MTNENANIDATNETETTEAPKNDKRRADLNKFVKKLGEEAALGKDSLPKLAHAVVQAAADGVITPDDAKALYTRYAEAESNKALHEHSVGGLNANISKLRQLIVMGCMTTIDAPSVMQAAYDERAKYIEETAGAEGADRPKFKSAYPFYIDLARAQQKSDTPLAAEHMRELMVKPEPKGKELEGELKAILSRLEGLVTGENKAGLKDTHDNTEAAFHLLKERVDSFAKARLTLKLKEEAAKLGLTVG